MRNLFMMMCTLVLALACIKSVESTGPASTPADPESEQLLKEMAAEEQADGHEHGDHTAACSCPKGKAGGTTWCESCNVGYINGEKTTDKDATVAATAEEHTHAEGHDHAHGDEAGACSCSKGKAGGTAWCEKCGVGYIEGEKTTDKEAFDAATASPEAEAAPEE